MVTCNGYRNPALLAKLASTVDVMSRGRLDFGVGAGWYEDEWRAYGYGFPEVPERMGRFREACEIIHRMFTEEYPSFKGKYYSIDRPINEPKGVQKPHPPIWIGGRSERGSRRGARLGYPFLLVGGPAQYRQLQTLFAEVGRSPEELRVAASRTVFIADSRQEAWRIIGPQVLYGHNERLRWNAEDGGSVYEPVTDWEVLRAQEEAGTLIGSPDDCLAGIRAFIATVPVRQIWFPVRIGGVDQQAAYRSLERFAREVMPHLR